jgi:ribonuclease III
MDADLDALEARIGHRFAARELLVRALTHKSLTADRASGDSRDNEQLEFLGDSVLGFVISDCLVRRYPSYPEGKLSKLKAHLVSAARLYEVAKNLQLGDCLFLGKGEELSGGRAKKALLANAVEAVIAAIYLDGGMEPARALVENRVIGDFAFPDENESASMTDYKSALQERAQSMRLPPPRYVIVREEGPEHHKVFTVEARLGKEYTGQAKGLSKKSAGQEAARQILEALQITPSA